MPLLFLWNLVFIATEFQILQHESLKDKPTQAVFWKRETWYFQQSESWRNTRQKEKTHQVDCVDPIDLFSFFARGLLLTKNGPLLLLLLLACVFVNHTLLDETLTIWMWFLFLWERTFVSLTQKPLVWINAQRGEHGSRCYIFPDQIRTNTSSYLVCASKHINVKNELIRNIYLWGFQDNMAASLEQSPSTAPSVYNMDIYRIKVN